MGHHKKLIPTEVSYSDDYFVGGISNVTNYGPEEYYFDVAMRWVDEGTLTFDAAGKYFRDSLAHHYNPRNVAEPILADLVEAQ